MQWVKLRVAVQQRSVRDKHHLTGGSTLVQPCKQPERYQNCTLNYNIPESPPDKSVISKQNTRPVSNAYFVF